MNALEKKANECLEIAKIAEQHLQSWVDFSNLMFSPQFGGVCCTLFPERSDRENFVATPQYAEIKQIMHHLMKQNPDAEQHVQLNSISDMHNFITWLQNKRPASKRTSTVAYTFKDLLVKEMEAHKAAAKYYVKAK